MWFTLSGLGVRVALKVRTWWAEEALEAGTGEYREKAGGILASIDECVLDEPAGSRNRKKWA